MKKSVTIAAAIVLSAIITSSLISSTASNLTVSQAQASSKYPMTITNCGSKFTLAKMPERVVSLYSVTTELMLRLGLEKKIVAAANFGEAMPADLEPAYKALNLIGKIGRAHV